MRGRLRLGIAMLTVALAWGCATAPRPQPVPQTIRGVASWYGQEFAGRTTANGEIFDPMLFTAAHRTLPFGTVVDVKNVATGDTVRVRINDRGPYISGRMIDLSYAAAKQIGLIEPGSGEVELSVVKVGQGDREAPVPYVVTVPDVKPIPDTPPASAATSGPANNAPVVVDNVQVVTEKQSVETRLEVSADGRKVEEVPVRPAQKAAADAAKPIPPAATAQGKGKFVVQVGAFALEANAKRLLSQLKDIGQAAYIESGALFLVRIGPFASRELALQARTRLEGAGLSAIIVAQ